MAKEPLLERRSLARNAASIDVHFHVYNTVEKKPLTPKVPGLLVNLSAKGACLEIGQPMIDGYHLMRDDDVEGATPLFLDLPASGDRGPFLLKARVLWYNRIPGGTQFHFRVGIKFIDVSPEEKKALENLIRTATTSAKE
ncbi:MAG: PilZ domain-containing protein [Planctomycetaceae bacterium]